MSTLSHTTKVAVRRALKAMATIDRTMPVTTAQFKAEVLTARKAGFLDRADLEQFARKHHLL